MRKALVASAIACMASGLVGQSTQFGSQQVLTTGLVGARSVVAADLDGDGNEDLLCAWATANTIGWLANDGSGNFGAPQIITTAISYCRHVEASDIDGDGDLDVVYGSRDTGTAAWHTNDGTGAFSQQLISSPLRSRCPAQCRSVIAALVIESWSN